MPEDDGCPKRMEYGPCGGVRPDLTCEMAAHPCPFAVGGEVVAWHGEEPPAPGPSALLERARTRPVVLTDLTVRPFDAANVRAVTRILAGSCDALLVGEHHGRPDFPPALMATLIRDMGGQPVITLSCRDRNRVVLEQEVAGLAEVGVAGVLCVTGDGRAPGVRLGATQVFDVDGTRLAALAAAAGLVAAVPEAPDAPPVPIRPARLREKQRAGARLAVLNHVGSVDRLAAFAAAARAAGATVPLVAGVAVYTDEHSASVLQRFPGLHLDPEQVDAVLRAPDPVAAGIAAAVAEARALLAVDGVVGVNLSGSASARGVEFAAGIKAEVGRRISGGRAT
ncbi:methylenetetrahydrofolate reductase [Pseudonocardia humida]|uniref:methylenetetrahydrofolate reductase n=1 Tax=Pseudonocardia humida TaxID=2800819 RepID=UPI00207D5937|nr:methylenetetrahydrofolate reductase [Pseudonocardia humida]